MAGLAVPQPKADEDAHRLELALQAGEVQGAGKGFGREVEPGLNPVAFLPVAQARLIKAVVAIPQQAGEIVGGWADQGVLEVDYPQAPIPVEKQVAAVVVPVGQALRLALRIVDQRLEGALRAGVEGFAEPAPQEPLAEDAELIS